MARPKIEPTGNERFFEEDEIIVSKTDYKGYITYANNVFLRVALYEEHEILGQNHNCIRHPEMPRCVFKLLWDTVLGGSEIFAYVVNLAKNGDHYWVFAHVTPSFDAQGEIIGFHSNRRVADRDAIKKASELYAMLLEIEQSASDRRKGMLAAEAKLLEILQEHKISYDEFVFSL